MVALLADIGSGGAQARAEARRQTPAQGQPPDRWRAYRHQRGGHRRRVRHLTGDRDEKAAHGQGELFPVYRYHAVFTGSPFEALQSEGQHRAIVEQVIADLNAGPLAHLPSGQFAANGAWLVIARHRP
jgi:hypothetical protein